MESRCRKYSASLDQKNEGEGSVIRSNVADETLIQGSLREESDALEMRCGELKWFHSSWADELGARALGVGNKHITINKGFEPRQPHLLTHTSWHTDTLCRKVCGILFFCLTLSDIVVEIKPSSFPIPHLLPQEYRWTCISGSPLLIGSLVYLQAMQQLGLSST